MGGLGNQLFQLAAALSVSKNSQTCAITSLTEPRKSNNFNSDIENFTINNRVLFLNGYKNWIDFAKQFNSQETLVNNIKQIFIKKSYVSLKELCKHEGFSYYAIKTLIKSQMK